MGSRAKKGGALSVWRRDRWIVPLSRMHVRVAALTLALGVAAYACAAGLMFTSGYLISGAATMPATVLALHMPIILVRVFGVGKPVVQYIERLESHEWVLRVTSRLRLDLYRACIRPAAVAMRRTGDMLGLLSEDIGHIQNLYLRTVLPFAIAWALGILVTLATGLFSPWLAAAMLLVFFVTSALMPLVTVLALSARRLRAKSAKNDLYGMLTDNVLGVVDWVCAGRGEDYLARHGAAEEDIAREQRAMARFARWRDFAMQAVFAAGVVALLAWAAARFGEGAGDANFIAAFVLAFFPLIEAFSPLSDAALDAVAYTDTASRLNALPGKQNRACSPRVVQEPFDLRIENATFSYEDASRPALDSLTLRIPQGQRIAVLGRSGAGKSTLVSLIRGDIAPQEGLATVGGVPCADVRDISRYVGVIGQNPYLFNDTLFENLRIANPDATPSQAEEALEVVGLGALLASLPDGLQTRMGDAGARFSGGERHRIALARVLLQDAPIVVLDEPFAGLDPATERALLASLFEALAGRTLIMVTHHLQGVSQMDRAVFIDEGRIAFEGEPSRLARENEEYRRLLAFDAAPRLPRV